MKIGVTGAHGFIGQWLCDELAQAGHDVVGTDRATGFDLLQRDAFAGWLHAHRPSTATAAWSTTSSAAACSTSPPSPSSAAPSASSPPSTDSRPPPKGSDAFHG